MADVAGAVETAVEPRTGYFQQSWTGNVILGSFFLVTLPMALVIWRTQALWLLWVYIWLFGMTHFVLTFTIYFNQANLRYFNQTWKNRLIYFILPVLIFAIFDLIHASRAGERFPLFALYFLGVIRLLDFNHLNRQSFGVLLLFKTRDGLASTRQLKRVELLYFNLLTLLMFTTFLAGGISPLLQDGGPLTLFAIPLPAGIQPALPIEVLQIAALMLIFAVGGLFVWLAGQYAKAKHEAGIEGSQPFWYLTFQSLSALLGAVSIFFYPATLALHYVEYHVLMVPRCFQLKLDESSRVDRLFAWLRRTPARFYGILLAIAAVATVCVFTGMGAMGITQIDPNAAFGYIALIALFDGLFVFHYLVETFIWRFSEPHYRNQLAGLYFAPKPAAPAV